MSACGTWGLWHSVTAPLVRPQDMRVTSVTDDTTVLLCRLLYPPPARLPRTISGAYDNGGFQGWAEAALQELEAEAEIERRKRGLDR